MEKKLGEMRKGRRERIEKGAFVSSSPQGIFQTMHYSKKICHGVKQNAKIYAIGEQNVIN